MTSCGAKFPPVSNCEVLREKTEAEELKKEKSGAYVTPW